MTQALFESQRDDIEHTAWWRWRQGMCSTSSRWLSISACATTCLRHVLSSTRETGGTKMCNKSCFYYVFEMFSLHKNYSCGSVKLRLNPWCYMDCFTDLLAMFPDMGTFQLCCCLWRIWKLSDSNKNILICVPTISGLTGLERHQGE